VRSVSVRQAQVSIEQSCGEAIGGESVGREALPRSTLLLCSRIMNGPPAKMDTSNATKRFLLLNTSLWLGFLVALGTALRLFRLGARSLWLDEAISAMLARIDRHTFVSAVVHRQANMVLYYVLLRGWIRLGSSEFALRSLSVVAGVAAIPAIYLLGKRLFGGRAGRVAALLLCVHAFHIRYSQEGRSYSLVMLLAVLSSLFFLRCLEEPSRWNWAAYIAFSTLMVYAQVFGGWVLVAQWSSLFLPLFFKRSEFRCPIHGKQFFFSAAAICFLIAPLAYCLLFVSDRSQLAWLAKPSMQDLYKFCLDLTGNGGTILLLVYLALVLAALAAVIMGRRSAPDSGQLWKHFFLLLWLILPPLLLLVISLRWPAFEPRFLIICIPPLLLLAANGLSRVRSKILFSAALMIALALSVAGVDYYYRGRVDDRYTDDWRDATHYILSQAEPGDAIVFTYSEEKLAFDEYQSRFHGENAPLDKYPDETDAELLTRGPSRLSDQSLDGIIVRCRRVSVISAFQPDRLSRQVEAKLGVHFSSHRNFAFGFVRVDLFADPIAGSAIDQSIP
jgi:mannosyltransferase